MDSKWDKMAKPMMMMMMCVCAHTIKQRMAHANSKQTAEVEEARVSE
jgi:hypothetical protein